MPTFDPVAPQDAFEVVNDEAPQATYTCNGNDYLFTFLVDRSASMGFNGDRMKLAKEALKLFVQSLPAGSGF